MENSTHDIHTISHFHDKAKGIFLISVIFLINASFIYFNNKDHSLKYDPINYNHSQRVSTHLRLLDGIKDDQSAYNSIYYFTLDLTYFFYNTSDTIYTGEWSAVNNPNNFESNKGRIQCAINKGYSPYNNNTYIIVGVKIYDDEYIDNWYYLKAIQLYTFNNITNIMDFERSVLTMLDSTAFTFAGHLFERVNENYGKN
jgi:hypothetical protein